MVGWGRHLGIGTHGEAPPGGGGGMLTPAEGVDVGVEATPGAGLVTRPAGATVLPQAASIVANTNASSRATMATRRLKSTVSVGEV